MTDPERFRQIARWEAACASENSTCERKSPVSRMWDWLIPGARRNWVRVNALWNSAGTLSELSALLDHAVNQPVVSLDFFDTLVVRHVEPPQYVLGKVAEISVALISRHTGIRISESTYLRGRHYCEQALRALAEDGLGLDQETSLPQMLDRLLTQLGIGDADLVQALVAAEMALESDVLELNSGALNLLTGLKRLDKKVLLLSDTYLTVSQLHHIAGRLEISGLIDRIYASGEVGLGKHSGRLFQHVLTQENVAPKDVLHIGDNRRSDFRVPKSLGIAARWLYQSQHVRRRFQVERQLRKDPIKFLERFVEHQADVLYEQAEVLEKHLFTGIAPAVFFMAYRSLNDCISLGITRLYFLAREGITLKQVYELLISNHPEFKAHTFTTSVLYCSRASTVCGRFKGSTDMATVVATALGHRKKITYGNLLASWNIRDADLGYLFEEPPHLATPEDVKHLFASNPEFSAAFEERVFGQQENLRQYLAQEGVLDQPCAFIDVGWGGTIQQNIEALDTGAQIYGLYLGTDHRFEARNLRGYLFSPADYRAGGVYKSAPVTETLLSVSGMGTTISYEIADGQILPRMKSSPSLDESVESARHRVFADFNELFYTLTRELCIPATVLAESARARYFNLVCRPNMKFVRAIRDLDFAFDWGDPAEHKLVLALSISDFFHPARLLRRLWKAPWLFGTLKANHLGFLNAPVSWLLGHEERINFRKLRRRLPRLFDPS